MMFQTFSENFVSVLGHCSHAVTSRRVTEITGIASASFNGGDERGIVVPARESHKCIYSFDDLAEIAVICELRQRRRAS